uniref:Uncharacterized protein n=1 Tax=Rhizophora mucronata TaxID=61149 RepID=A0A2P2L4M3_RHIMU
MLGTGSFDLKQYFCPSPVPNSVLFIFFQSFFLCLALYCPLLMCSY